ncbi:MAG: hypothetical protein NC419_04645 [Muribaculaceae bacterium]|nr:hypothetical protein [Muribaculaceae bacterium]
MKKRLQGLIVLWLAAAMVLSFLPAQVWAAETTQSMYVYTENGAGVMQEYGQVETRNTKFVSVTYDQPLNEQEAVMQCFTIPQGYGLKGWEIWKFIVSGGGGIIYEKGLELAANGTISESEFQTIKGADDGNVLIVPILASNSGLKVTISATTGDSWDSFLGGVTFDKTFSPPLTLTISTSGGYGSVEIDYYLANEDLFPAGQPTDKEIEGAILNWTQYTGNAGAGIQLSQEGQYVLYARAKDVAGNTVYANTDGIIIGTADSGNNQIDSSGEFHLLPGTAYTFGSGKWKVTGDSTVYEGGRTFYVSQDDMYTLTQQ